MLRAIYLEVSQHKPRLTTYLPIILWPLLWLSLSPGSLSSILNPSSIGDLTGGIRALFPFAAALTSAIVIAYNLIRHRPSCFRLFGPIGLMGIYGLVGLLATWKSPDNAVAIRWVILYLSVPIVLGAIAWGKGSLERVGFLLNSTWFVFILGTITLFAIGVVYLDFRDELLHPTRLLHCGSGGWYDLTNGRLRDTGVGRYAAIAGIIAISGLWRPNWKFMWGTVLILCVLLLLFSGARGAMAGFALSAVITVSLYGGKRAILTGALSMGVFVSIFWATGLFETFYNDCLVRDSRNKPSEQKAQPPTVQEKAAPQIKNQNHLAQSQQVVATAMPIQTTTPTSINNNGITNDALDRKEDFRSDPIRPETLPDMESILAQGVEEFAGSIDIKTPQKAKLEQPQHDRTEDQESTVRHMPKNAEMTGSEAATSLPFTSDRIQNLESINGPATEPKTLGQDETDSLSEGPLVKTQDQTHVGKQKAESNQTGGKDLLNVSAHPSNIDQHLKSEDTDSEIESLNPVFDSTKAVRRGFFEFTGRSAVWREALLWFNDSPIIGYGFHADRLLLGTHTHNAFVHAMIQTGLLGTTFFLGSISLSWVLFLRSARKLKYLPERHKHLLIQSGAVLGFLTVRGIPESTGSFFGVDWLILAPVILYLQLIYSQYNTEQHKSIE